VTPTELVYKHHPLPYPLYEFQRSAVDESAERDRTGLYFDVGTGKSPTSTVIALYKILKYGKLVIVVMPPILITMWSRFLAKIPGITHLAYRGTPKKRAEMNLQGFNFILMSIQIFKKDYDHLTTQLRKRDKLLIVDEATSIKNVESDNHLAVAHLATIWEAELLLLTGTPLSTPIDAYAYIKLIAPGTYRTLQHFENVHVESRDIFDKVTEWKNLELVAENMRKNSIRVLREDVLKELPPVTHTPLAYELSSKHYALYKKLATEELLEMEAGGKIDATSVSALFHALQQIILNPDVFAEDPTFEAAGVEMLDEIMAELGDKKLVVFTNYRMTNAKLEKHTAEKYNGRTIYGGTSNAKQQAALDEFVNNPTCRSLTLQVQAGGMGIDDLQTVCNDMLFLEFPTIPSWYHQAVARLHRNGQKFPVNVRVAIAEGTTQPDRFRRLMDNDQLVNTVIRNFEDLRAAVFSKY
jgi:SNF2 family DNA or RNA helicase